MTATMTRILAGVVLLAGVATGCTNQDADLAADAIRSASQPAEPATGVDVNQARQQLAWLTIRPESPAAEYSRELFPHWSTVSGQCNTRETVLRQQGTGVRVDSRCRPVSGTWVSPYDGQVWADASDVDVDHLVPLAEAWRSGAATWSEADREAFANDLNNPQLVAVTDNENQSKGDDDPAGYRPPLRSYWCTYADMWITVKTAHGLSADPAEAAALGDMLDTCGGAQ